MTVHSTSAPTATRRILLTIAIVAAGLIALLAIRLDAFAHGAPHMTPVAVGTTDDRIVIKTHPKASSTVNTFRLDFDQADAATPWHSHPGQGLVTVTSGTFELTVAGTRGCTTQTLQPGETFFDSGTVHRLVLKSTSGSVAATFVTPTGVPLTEPAPAPSC